MASPSAQAALAPALGWVYFRRGDDGAGGPHWSRPTVQHSILLSSSGMLEYYETAAAAGHPPVGSLSLVRAVITPLGSSVAGGTAALQVKLAEGNVVHIETTDDAERDRWCFELNLAGLRAASSELHSVAASTPASRASSPAPRAPDPPPQQEQLQQPLQQSALSGARQPYMRTYSQEARTAPPPPSAAAPPPPAPPAISTPVSPPLASSERGLGVSSATSANSAYRGGGGGSLRASASLGASNTLRPQQQQRQQQRQQQQQLDADEEVEQQQQYVAVEPARASAPDPTVRKPIGLMWADENRHDRLERQRLPAPSRLPPPSSYSSVRRLSPPRSARSELTSPPSPATSTTVKRPNWGAIASFIDGASVFAVSRMWSDLIGIFAFGLHAVPFCGGFLEDPCTPDASAKAQFVYALGCVPVAGLLKHLSEGRYKNMPGASMVPTMMGYFVGWAVGSAFLKVLLETAEANPALCSETTGCTGLNIFYSLGVTFGAAFVIILLQPYSQDIDCGDGECVNWFEDWLEDIWQLVIRGASATSMVLWYHTAAHYASAGTDGASNFAKTNLLACFTLVTFFFGSLLSLKLEQAEEYLRGLQRQAPASWRAALVRYSDVLQNLLGYVCGCLSTDVITEVFSSLNDGPTLAVFITNLGITAASTLICAFYLSHSGTASIAITNNGDADRDQVEAFFITNSMGFFVGWKWLVVARDLVTMVGLLLRGLLSPFGVTSAQDHVTQLAAVLLACPFLTLGVWWLQLQTRGLAGETGPTARAEKEKQEMTEERKMRKATVAAADSYWANSCVSGRSAVSPGWRRAPNGNRMLRSTAQLN